jgi:predicted RNA-binding protein with PUA-like domain
MTQQMTIKSKKWLFKSEPCKWSWDMQMAAGETGTFWDGVRNHLAKKNMLAMQVGDRGFFYHSNEGKEIVGIVEIIQAAYHDPSAEINEPWVVVDIMAKKTLPHPVSLAMVKAEPKLAQMSLVTSARLSVQPVSDDEWETICKMGGL